VNKEEDMTEPAPDRLWSGIDIPKTLAGALAAVCAAVVGSFLGVAGTLVGAAVASIVGSVATEIYHRSLRKGAKKLQTLTPAFVKVPAAVGTPEVAAASEDDSPSHTVPDGPPRQIRWGRIAMIAGALFVLAMGSLSIAELLAGRSVASAVGNDTKARTTWSGIFDHGTDAKPTPAPSVAPTDTAPASGGDTQPTTGATEGPKTTAEPTTGPTAAPPTAAPDQTPPADTQDPDLKSDPNGQSTP
jgi:hypothetical protein